MNNAANTMNIIDAENTVKDTFVTISNETASLGDASTEEDVTRFAQNLEDLLNSEFPALSIVVQTRPCLRSECSNEDVLARVAEIGTSDEWLTLL